MDAVNLAKNIIEKSQNILISTSPELQGDNLGSTLALFYTLKKLGKNVNVRIGDVPEKFKFLANNYLPSVGNFVISVNTEGKEISQMRYEKNGKDLKIYLALNKGQVSRDDVSFAPSATQESSVSDYDLLITIGNQSLESVPQNLWTLPMLNIDNQPRNENFGEVNLIEMTSSLAEIATGLIKSIGNGDLFDKEISTCLLAGVIWSSQNFRNPKTRPKTFETSAFLIEKGANHQEIIQRLYKQKNISQIKLLGKTLENLSFCEPKEIYSANIKESDFKECQASSKDLSFVLEELKFHFRHLPNLLILWESHASPPITKGIFYSPNQNLTEKIIENFESNSNGAGAIFLVRETDLNIAREKVLNIL
ncbi:MAG: hypothetical protein HYT20_02805 [Candidatus Nealsonbacteria bacterium]|nr:hypothetical protein [Candidatus Nealsonbacteria bacterium]